MTKTATWRKNPDTGEWLAYIPGKPLPAGTPITLERKDGTNSAAVIVDAVKTVSKGVLYSFKHTKPAPIVLEPAESIPEIVPVSVPACEPASVPVKSCELDMDMDALDVALGISIGVEGFVYTGSATASKLSCAELDIALGLTD